MQVIKQRREKMSADTSKEHEAKAGADYVELDILEILMKSR